MTNPHSARARVEQPGAGTRVERHLLQSYAGPLRDYYRSTPWYRVFGHLPGWRPEVVVRDFLGSLAENDFFRPAAGVAPDRPLRSRLADGLRRDLRRRRRDERRHRIP